MMCTRYQWISLIALCMVAACSVGPDYKKPSTPVPGAFKEAAQGWKLATPQDLAPRGEWWQIFHDSGLNELEAQVNINNQNIKVAEANYRQAQALVSQARASFFPSVSADVSQTRQNSGSQIPIHNTYTAEPEASWEIDIWGKIRRTVEASKANAEASEAELAAAQLSAQATLATDYLSLRVADEQKRYLNETVVAYKKSLDLTESLYKNGVNTRADYLQAKVQLESAQAQAVDVDVQRTAFEHAIAVLIGKAPADFTLAPVPTVPSAPVPPVTLPSTVLERRPDVANAERLAAVANANIGVAEAAFYPDLTLSAAGGYASTALSQWFTSPARVWSIGPSIVQTVFDAGLRSAQTDQAIAAYDASVATYRQTVLSAFQDVEDNLAAVRVLREEEIVRDATVVDSKASTAFNMDQYKAGITSYLSVITAQTTELTNALAALSVKQQRLTAAVNLIKALGGGWRVDVPAVEIPAKKDAPADEQAPVKLAPPKQ